MQSKNQYRFSIITPTYNRAHLLGRLCERLEAETLRDFEWIVVDDGSADSTRLVVEQLSAKASFPVRYIYQTNSGKHVAVNVAVRMARGYFVGILDSDDKYTTNALNSSWAHWQQIPEAEQLELVGVTALCAEKQGHVRGSRFPAALFDFDADEC